ncbi:MAG: pre-toxin TG domain-containing protein [Bacillota bacterium]|nr:pre-toxin TG domain-containing protein [Bacillota bacterium]
MLERKATKVIAYILTALFVCVSFNGNGLSIGETKVRAESNTKTLVVGFGESMSPSESKTISIPDLLSITEMTANQGNVTYDVNGKAVTINVSGGLPSRTDTPTKTASSSRTGDSSSFPSSISYTEGGYFGTLYATGSSYVDSTTTIPGDSKLAYDSRSASKWELLPSSIPYNDGVYSGTLTWSNNPVLSGSTWTVTYSGTVQSTSKVKEEWRRDYSGTVYGTATCYYEYSVTVKYIPIPTSTPTIAPTSTPTATPTVTPTVTPTSTATNVTTFNVQWFSLDKDYYNYRDTNGFVMTNLFSSTNTWMSYTVNAPYDGYEVIFHGCSYFNPHYTSMKVDGQLISYITYGTGLTADYDDGEKFRSDGLIKLSKGSHVFEYYTTTNYENGVIYEKTKATPTSTHTPTPTITTASIPTPTPSPMIKALMIDPPTMTIVGLNKLGDMLKVTAIYSNGPVDVTSIAGYSSDDRSIADMDNGFVKSGTHSGSTTIRVKYLGAEGTCKVTVGDSTPTPNIMPTSTQTSAGLQKPEIISPVANAIVNTHVTINWSHVTGVDHYLFSLVNLTDNKYIAKNIDIGNKVNYSAVLEPGKKYRTCVAAANKLETDVNWSYAVEFSASTYVTPSATATTTPTVTPSKPPLVLKQPSINSPSAGAVINDETVKVSWTAVSKATYYKLALTDLTADKKSVHTVKITNFTLTLTEGHQYSVSVAACAPNALDSWSSARTFSINKYLVDIKNIKYATELYDKNEVFPQIDMKLENSFTGSSRKFLIEVCVSRDKSTWYTYASKEVEMSRGDSSINCSIDFSQKFKSEGDLYTKVNAYYYDSGTHQTVKVGEADKPGTDKVYQSLLDDVSYKNLYLHPKQNQDIKVSFNIPSGIDTSAYKVAVQTRKEGSNTWNSTSQENFKGTVILNTTFESNGKYYTRVSVFKNSSVVFRRTKDQPDFVTAGKDANSSKAVKVFVDDTEVPDAEMKNGITWVPLNGSASKLCLLTAFRIAGESYTKIISKDKNSIVKQKYFSFWQDGEKSLIEIPITFEWKVDSKGKIDYVTYWFSDGKKHKAKIVGKSIVISKMDMELPIVKVNIDVFKKYVYSKKTTYEYYDPTNGNKIYYLPQLVNTAAAQRNQNEFFSMTLSKLPVIQQAYAGANFLAGKDVITGDKLTFQDQILIAVDLFPGGEEGEEAISGLTSIKSVLKLIKDTAKEQVKEKMKEKLVEALDKAEKQDADIKLIAEAYRLQLKNGEEYDDFETVFLPKGSNLYQLVGSSNKWFTDLDAMMKSNYSSSSLHGGLQLLNNSNKVNVYKATEDMTVAVATAQANSKQGKGGFTRYFVSDLNKLKLVDPISPIYLKD